MQAILTLGLVLSLSACLLGCSKNGKGEPPPFPRAFEDTEARPPAESDNAGTATVTAVGEGAETAPDVGAIYFEFDSVTLSSDARAALKRLADWLNGRNNRLTIEGHADERGTTEYNVALGQRRAEVIAEYLTRLGIARARLDTISYGEEHPSEDGHDESAWARNRRGEVRPR